MKTKLIVGGLWFVSLAFPVVAQEKRQDSIELKTGRLLVGKVTQIDDEKEKLTIELNTKGELTLSFSDLVPYSVYKIKVSRLDPNSAQAHFDLGNFALKSGLYHAATTEYNKAQELDVSLKESVAKKLDEVKAVWAQSLLEEVRLLIKQEKLLEASQKIGDILIRFDGTPTVDDAKKEQARIKELIAEREKKLKEQEEERKKKELDEKLKLAEREVKDHFDRAVKIIDETRQLNAQGLLEEGRAQYVNAAKTYLKAEQKLFDAKAAFADVLSRAKDVTIIDAAKAKGKDIDQTLLALYHNLGMLYIFAERYQDATLWLNKALIIDPNDKVAMDMKLKVTDMILRQREASLWYLQNNPPPKK